MFLLIQHKEDTFFPIKIIDASNMPFKIYQKNYAIVIFLHKSLYRRNENATSQSISLR